MALKKVTMNLTEHDLEIAENLTKRLNVRNKASDRQRRIGDHGRDYKQD